MNTLYNILLTLTTYAINFIALFNTKLKLGVTGRRQTFKLLQQHITSADKVMWFHCASLGEYEQGLPVFKALRSEYPNHKIVLSFFSPSGYVHKQNSSVANVVVYLPWDTLKNVSTFLNITHPSLVVFVKYDVWPNYLTQLKKRNTKTLLISAAFREHQIYFKWYGKLFKKALFGFDYIFTQNKTSQHLLQSIGYTNTAVSGDTRFDRVSHQLTTNNSVDFIETFINNKPCIVFGSTWPEDDALFINFINTTQLNVKFIIAPHNVSANYTKTLINKLQQPTTSFSQKNTPLKQAKVYILDTIGYLSKVYSYANIAYVGGGAGKTGLHNILEPAVFGIPILIGKNYTKFPEAKALIEVKGVISVTNAKMMCQTIETLISNPEIADSMGRENNSYIIENKGASLKILRYIRKLKF